MLQSNVIVVFYFSISRQIYSLKKKNYGIKKLYFHGKFRSPIVDKIVTNQKLKIMARHNIDNNNIVMDAN